MKKTHLIFAMLFYCSIQYGCGIITMTHDLEPHHSKNSIEDHIVINGQDTIFLFSHIEYAVPVALDGPISKDASFDSTHTLYWIKLFLNNQIPSIMINSITVTEEGNPIPFSVYYKDYPTFSEKKLAQEIDTLPSIIIVEKGHPLCIYVRIDKKMMDMKELTINYQINIDGTQIDKKHQYKKKYALGTKMWTIISF